MTTSKPDELVRDYLERLESELADVPADRREEIVSEMRSHIAEERASGAVQTEADLHNMLERLGEPAEIASAARPAGGQAEEAPAPQRSAGLVEVLAMVLTPIIWPVGVILYWTSPRWRTRDKWIATLLPPGGYPVLLFFFVPYVFLSAGSGTCISGGDSQGNFYQSCTGLMALPRWEQVVIGIALIGLVVVLLLLPVLVGIYMARRLSKTAAVEVPRPGHQIGLIEVLAMVLTPVIWPVGVILYWTSSHWRTRDKLIATLIPPGGYPGLLFASPFLLFSSTVSGGCGYTTDMQGHILSQQCTGFDALPAWEQVAIQASGIAALLLVISLPVLVGIYMAWRLRREIARSTT